MGEKLAVADIAAFEHSCLCSGSSSTRENTSEACFKQNFVLHGLFSKIGSYMALTVNSLLTMCNLPYGRKLLNMQISIACHCL